MKYCNLLIREVIAFLFSFEKIIGFYRLTSLQLSKNSKLDYNQDLIFFFIEELLLVI